MLLRQQGGTPSHAWDHSNDRADESSAAEPESPRQTGSQPGSSLLETTPDGIVLTWPRRCPCLTNIHFKNFRRQPRTMLKTPSHRRRTGKSAVLDTLTNLTNPARLLQPKAFGCTTGTQFFSMNSVPNCVFDGGDNLSTFIPEKVVFTAANLLSQLITFFPGQKGG